MGCGAADGPQLAEAKNQLTEAIDRLSEANKAVSAAEMRAEEIASQCVHTADHTPLINPRMVSSRFREVIVGTQDLERRIKNLEQLRDQSDTKYEARKPNLRSFLPHVPFVDRNSWSTSDAKKSSASSPPPRKKGYPATINLRTFISEVICDIEPAMVIRCY